VDLQKLRAFTQVARSGGFTSAARRLGLSQPTVSLQVQGLERELGVKLFDRRARQVHLTPDGEQLLELARRIFETEDEILVAFTGRGRVANERLTLATNQSIAAHILPPLLAKYTAHRPSVEIHIHNLRTAEIVASVQDGTTHVGIILIDPKIPVLVARPVLPYEMVLVTPRDHPLSRRPRVTLEDIAQFPFVSYTRDTETRALIDQPFEAGRLKTSIRMALGSTDLIIKYVSLGYGVSIIHNLNIDEANRENLHVRPLDRYYARRYIYLLSRGEDALSPAVKAFCELF
jgi:DNA-binding transcriptional LysR family regulator